MLTVSEIQNTLMHIRVGTTKRLDKGHADDKTIKDALLQLLRFNRYYELRDQATYYSVKRLA